MKTNSCDRNSGKPDSMLGQFRIRVVVFETPDFPIQLVFESHGLTNTKGFIRVRSLLFAATPHLGFILFVFEIN